MRFLSVHKRILFFLCILFLVSCGTTRRKTFVVAGTYLTVTSPDERAARIVYDEFKRLDKIFNIYDSLSEVSMVNRSEGVPVTVSRDFIELLNLSRQMYELTDGAFDVTKGALYAFWKKRIEKGSIKQFPTEGDVRPFLDNDSFAAVRIDMKENTVTLTQRGMTLDFGGIAKGFMVDKAVRKLKEAGISSALVDAGGDIFCLGTDAGVPWKIGIREPAVQEGIIDTVPIIDGAVATSGDYEQFFTYKGKRYSHIIDPKTGFPVTNGIISVTVVVANCTSADGLATAFFVMGTDGIRMLYEKTMSNARIFVVTEEEGKEKLYVY